MKNKSEYKDKYVYLAIFDYADDGISISFPDLKGCLTCADTDEQALLMAEEVLGLWMENLEAEYEIIPEPSELKNIKLKENQKTVLISVWMPFVRRAINNKAIKKTLSIPQWLDIMARENDINFSFVLQEALKNELKILR